MPSLASTIIKKFEGCRLTAYLDSVGIPTIGFGHTKDVRMGQTITQHQADVIFDSDLEPLEEKVRAALGPNATENQVAACTSFAFNEGLSAFLGSEILANYKSGNLAHAADCFLHWTRAGALKDLLLSRRQTERLLFLTP